MLQADRGNVIKIVTKDEDEITAYIDMIQFAELVYYCRKVFCRTGTRASMRKQRPLTDPDPVKMMEILNSHLKCFLAELILDAESVVENEQFVIYRQLLVEANANWITLVSSITDGEQKRKKKDSTKELEQAAANKTKLKGKDGTEGVTQVDTKTSMVQTPASAISKLSAPQSELPHPRSSLFLKEDVADMSDGDGDSIAPDVILKTLIAFFRDRRDHVGQSGDVRLMMADFDEPHRFLEKVLKTLESLNEWDPSHQLFNGGSAINCLQIIGFHMRCPAVLSALCCHCVSSVAAAALSQSNLSR